ncbi:MAG: lipid A phosphoethanolamine transferase [Muribaculaceae bacterium]|nr:lipid A phosphoethanolamine transferase [Muribaculaceae bacterium]
MAGILLPLGVYLLLAGLCRRAGLAALISLPIAFFCSFQIVLLYLYGESIIAIDMFMNIATTNVSEATELLGNLSVAIISVVVLYLPSVVLGAYLTCRRREIPPERRRPAVVSGILLSAAGTLIAICANCTVSGYDATREIFPLNVMCNLTEAFRRVRQSEGYAETSDDFKFHASCINQDSVPEVYVLVIGETSRADNWQLFGYDRETTPRLSRRAGLLRYPRTLSESNTTHKSVPMLLSGLTASSFGDSVYKVKSVFEAFNEAGINTVFLANQLENRSYIDFYAAQAKTHRRICSGNSVRHDQDLLSELAECLDSEPAGSIFITLHTYGSHYCYHERYTKDHRYFTPDGATDASAKNRMDLINAYDNTIRYTDELIDSIISILDERHLRSALVYTSDHGEDIFDDSRKRFLHASPTPTYWQLHVPLVIWMSPEFCGAYPAKYAAAVSNQSKAVSSTASVFDTILDMAGISADGHRCEQSLCSWAYSEPQRRYLNDYNEGVPLERSGLRENDFRMLDSLDRAHNIER